MCPDQNAINLSTEELTDAKKSFLRKGPSFIPNINLFNLKSDFDNLSTSFATWQLNQMM